MCWGIIQIVVAVLAISMHQRVVDAVLSIASFTNGPVLGVFLLGALTKRVGSVSALAGIATGIIVMIFVWARLEVSWQWYVLIGSMVTFLTGCVVSFVVEREVEPQST